jgi:hypothetical protein
MILQRNRRNILRQKASRDLRRPTPHFPYWKPSDEASQLLATRGKGLINFAAANRGTDRVR